MVSRIVLRVVFAITILSLAVVSGCSDNNPAEPAAFPTSADVFTDEFGPNITFEAFLGSKLDAVDGDAGMAQSGSRSLIVTVPDVGNPSGSYAGGAFTTSIARNLSQYNALTFYAKSSVPATLDVAGIGNDNTGSSRFTAEVSDLPLTTAWTKYVIPLPLADKLTSERGMFYFAEGPENGNGYTLWFDEIKFETLGTITNPQPTIPTAGIDAEAGDTISVGNGSVTYTVAGEPVTVSAMQGYFTFSSSDTTVVRVAGNGVITAVGAGTAELTATLGAVPASGTTSVTVIAAQPGPTTPAPTPSIPAGDVISLYSNAYTNVPVTTWSADWDQADVFDRTVGSDNVKKYENLVFAGIEFASPTVDASSMTHFHIDIWTPVPITGTSELKIKLVDFGANGVFDGAGSDDSEHELTFTQSTTPGLASQNWVSVDIPLAAFTGLTAQANLAQMVISGNVSTVYIDNVYFYDAGTVNSPLLPAPTPSEPTNNVVSLFSDAYTDVLVDTWSAADDTAEVADTTVLGNNVKKYTGLSSAGIEFANPTVDASALSHFHIDVWTPDPTGTPAALRIKLIDFGGDGLSGGGDDVEHELSFDATTIPALTTGSWISFDIPLSDFTGLTSTGHLGRIVLSGDPNTLFVDNVFFYSEGPTEPVTGAPTPLIPANDVVSLYSDAYSDVPVDTWSAVWDSAEVEDVLIASDNMKKYTDLLFAGVEFATVTVDASAMTHFHMDIWTPDPISPGASFKVKLVDWGADGAWLGGDDVEHELTFNETVLASGTWVSIDVPLTDFTGLTTKGHLAQLIMSGDPNTVFIDNIYFYDANLPEAPTVPAPTPSADPADVISLFSDAYSNVSVDTWSAVWDVADVEDVLVGTDNVKKYTNLLFAGIDFRSSAIDASGMTTFHLDIWTPDPTVAPNVLKVKLVDFGANGVSGGGDDVEHEVTFNETTLVTRDWVSIDITLADLTNLITREHIAQIVISGDPETVFVDNIYFYK